MQIVSRIAEVAERHDVPMADISLAWQWAKGITAPVVGGTKPERVMDVVRALEVELSAEDIAYLEEPYVAHDLVGPAGCPGEKAPAGNMKGLR